MSYVIESLTAFNVRVRAADVILCHGHKLNFTHEYYLKYVVINANNNILWFSHSVLSLWYLYVYFNVIETFLLFYFKLNKILFGRDNSLRAVPLAWEWWPRAQLACDVITTTIWLIFESFIILTCNCQFIYLWLNIY